MNRIKRIGSHLAHNKLLIGVVVVALLMIAQPSSNPLTVQNVEAATYPYQEYAQWRMDMPSDLGGWFTVQAATTWTTRDPSPPCFDSRRSTSLSGVSQYQALVYPKTKCANPLAHEYPMSVTDTQCWVSKAWIVSIQIDSCGPVASWWNAAPYYYTVGVTFRACVGIINTPFSVCDAYRALLHMGGSQVWVQYTVG